MSKKPTIKKITKDEAPVPEGDECVYYLSYNEDMTQIMLSVSAARPITPEEYMMALTAFVNDVEQYPDKLFVEDFDFESDMSKH
jgi:hypothetical protein